MRRVLYGELVERMLSADQLAVRGQDVSARAWDVAAAEVFGGPPQMGGRELESPGHLLIVASRLIAPCLTSILRFVHGPKVRVRASPNNEEHSRPDRVL
jgi:hypothetical protein